MNLTNAQLDLLKTWLTSGPGAGLQDEEAKTALNVAAAPVYWLWNEAAREADIYEKSSDLAVPTDWNYATYKAQSVTEQGAWNKVFMGGTANFARRNTRTAIHAIFGGVGSGNAQRDHVLAMGRRAAKVGEKLFAVAVVNPPANSGNNSGDARGAKTNPDEPGIDADGNLCVGEISAKNINDARSRP